MFDSSNGYIAIVSAMLISFVFMAIALGLSFSVYFGRFNVLNSEAKEKGLALAEACAELALLKLSLNPLYSGNETSTISGSDVCSILPITSEGDKRVIKTAGEFLHAVSSIKIIVTASPLAIVSWEETL